MNERIVGTTVRGLRAPILKRGDNLAQIMTDTVLKFLKQENVEIGHKDVVAVTESVVARSQGNYVTIDQVAQDISNKFGAEPLGVIFPILSRNRFAIILRAIAKSAAEKIIIMLSYPSDEVGNHLISVDKLDAKGVDPYRDVLSEYRFRQLFGYEKHPFTGMDYVQYYKDIVNEAGKECQIVFSNDPTTILRYTDHVLHCDIHTRERTRRILLEHGAKKCYGLDQIMTEPVDGSGFQPDYGLLGSNKTSEEMLKLFPRNCQVLVEKVQQKILDATGKTVEVMVYGDGAFKDPVGKIWELADPVVSPGYTAGLEGTPHEIKLKYVADNLFKDLEGKALQEALEEHIRQKNNETSDGMEGQGTTPRRLTDLLGSLCDLTSGSGDKGTPIIYIQGYFDNYAN